MLTITTDPTAARRWTEGLKIRLVDIEAEVCADCVCRDKCDRQAYCWAKAIQTVDAVPVVRCKECKWAGGDFVCYRGVMVQHKPEDFCSYGERKEGAEC